MKGEIGIKINKIRIHGPICGLDKGCDMQLVGENDEFLWIVGDNDIPALFQEALEEYHKEQKDGDNE